MSGFTIDGNRIAGVRSYSGFDVDDDIRHLRLLSDGESSHNEILQSSALPMPTAELHGRTSEATTINGLESLRRSHETVEFIDDLGVSRAVVVETFTKVRALPATFLWDYTLALIEVE